MKKVYELIRRLGANSKYKGYFFVAEAVKISMGYQYKPLRITKDIYPLYFEFAPSLLINNQ